jgi:DNA-binding beta-propeller fold protein YncE
VADYGNNQVMAFDAALNNTLNIPNPPQPAPNGGLNQPEGVAVRNSDGHVFVTDTFNHRIQEFTSTGTFVRAWGFRGITPDGLSYPRGVAIDQTTGNVWVNNTRSGNIKAFDPQGNFLRVFGSEGSGNGQFYYARGIAFGSGRVYVTDSGNLRLTVLNATTGAVVWSRPCGTRNPTNYVLFGCTSVALDPSGNVYAVAIWERAIYKFSPTGTLLFKRTYPQGSAQGSLNQPYGAAIRGNLLYVSERSNNRISVFDLNGAFQGVFGSTGTGHVQFRQPSAISIDSSGRIYVCETVGERIQVLQLN